MIIYPTITNYLHHSPLTNIDRHSKYLSLLTLVYIKSYTQKNISLYSQTILMDISMLQINQLVVQ